LLVSINTDTNENIIYFTFPAGNVGASSPVGASFSAFQFDDATSFIFCGDPGTYDPYFYCKIVNLLTWYTSHTTLEAPFALGDLYRR